MNFIFKRLLIFILTSSIVDSFCATFQKCDTVFISNSEFIIYNYNGNCNKGNSIRLFKNRTMLKDSSYIYI